MQFQNGQHGYFGFSDHLGIIYLLPRELTKFVMYQVHEDFKNCHQKIPSGPYSYSTDNHNTNTFYPFFSHVVYTGLSFWAFGLFKDSWFHKGDMHPESFIWYHRTKDWHRGPKVPIVKFDKDHQNWMTKDWHLGPKVPAIRLRPHEEGFEVLQDGYSDNQFYMQALCTTMLNRSHIMLISGLYYNKAKDKNQKMNSDAVNVIDIANNKWMGYPRLKAFPKLDETFAGKCGSTVLHSKSGKRYNIGTWEVSFAFNFTLTLTSAMQCRVMEDVIHSFRPISALLQGYK